MNSIQPIIITENEVIIAEFRPLTLTDQPIDKSTGIPAVPSDYIKPNDISKKRRKSKYHCTDCNSDFKNATEFENHKIEGQIKIECSICHTFFRRRDHLSRHMRTVHCENKSSNCPICNHNCKDLKTLTQHMTDCHSNESEYFCIDCGHDAKNLKDLISHKKNHVLNNKFVCDICTAAFKRQDHLNRHKKSLHLNHFVTCEICDQNFKRRDHLLRHLREQHGEAPTGKRIPKR